MKKLFIAGTICVLASVACGKGGIETPTGGSEQAAAPAHAELPQQILGLKVKAEDISSKLKSIRRPYVDAVAVYSLRDADLLKASLQISRFNGAARPNDPDFIGSIVSTIGGAASQLYRVSSEDVYVTTASDQIIFTWFRGKGMFVLAIQKSFPFPRTLVRRLVDTGVSV